MPSQEFWDSVIRTPQCPMLLRIAREAAMRTPCRALEATTLATHPISVVSLDTLADGVGGQALRPAGLIPQGFHIRDHPNHPDRSVVRLDSLDSVRDAPGRQPVMVWTRVAEDDFASRESMAEPLTYINVAQTALRYRHDPVAHLPRRIVYAPLQEKSPGAATVRSHGEEGMSLEDARLMALALEITSLMSNPNLPANQAYLSSGGSWLNLQVSPSDQVSVLCLALAGAIQE